MKVILVGGHLAPALAVIEALPKDARIVFIGRKSTFEGDQSKSLEYETINKMGIEFISLTTGRFQRKFSRHSIKSIFKIPVGLIQAIRILLKHKPDIVLSFGGYLSVPVGVAAFIFKVPLVIHEQTLKIGAANKFLSVFADKICISWPQSAKFFPKDKTILTGNPLRRHQASDYNPHILKANLPVIYITGGSAGAHALNMLVEGCLENLLEKYIVIHQTGNAGEFEDFSRLSALVKLMPSKLQNRYIIKRFINPSMVGVIMEKASLIVSRSGINTVSEILEYGKPCLLIPLPYGQINEQLENAQFIKKTGLGEYFYQQSLNSAKLLENIERIMENKHSYLVHAKFAQSLIKKNAALDIVKILYEVYTRDK